MKNKIISYQFEQNDDLMKDYNQALHYYLKSDYILHEGVKKMCSTMDEINISYHKN